MDACSPFALFSHSRDRQARRLIGPSYKHLSIAPIMNRLLLGDDWRRARTLSPPWRYCWRDTSNSGRRSCKPPPRSCANLCRKQTDLKGRDDIFVGAHARTYQYRGAPAARERAEDRLGLPYGGGWRTSRAQLPAALLGRCRLYRLVCDIRQAASLCTWTSASAATQAGMTFSP